MSKRAWQIVEDVLGKVVLGKDKEGTPEPAAEIGDTLVGICLSCIYISNCLGNHILTCSRMIALEMNMSTTRMYMAP